MFFPEVFKDNEYIERKTGFYVSSDRNKSRCTRIRATDKLLTIYSSALFDLKQRLKYKPGSEVIILKNYAKEEQKTADSTPGVTSPWLKNKFGIYVEEEMQKFQTPEYVSSKAGMLDRRG